jgi:hypothetical protein
VIQYNKRDLPNVYTLDELNAELNVGGKVPFFEAVAKDGKGVFETFRGISHLLMEKVTKDLRRGPGAPMAQAPSAPAPPSPKPELRPASLAGAASHAPDGTTGPGGLDYGREIELPGQKVTTPPPSASRDRARTRAAAAVSRRSRSLRSPHPLRGQAGGGSASAAAPGALSVGGCVAAKPRRCTPRARRR